jgi:hypothetical protein
MLAEGGALARLGKAATGAVGEKAGRRRAGGAGTERVCRKSGHGCREKAEGAGARPGNSTAARELNGGGRH